MVDLLQSDSSRNPVSRIGWITSVCAVIFALCPVPLKAQSTSCSSEEILFEHIVGETCIPKDPQRIVATWDSGGALPLLELGAPVVGTGFRDIGDGLSFVRGVTDVLGIEATKALEPIGSGLIVDVERVATLEPDLIIGYDFNEDIYQNLSRIAPTVLLPRLAPYKEYMQLLATAAGRMDEFDKRWAKYRSDVEEARTLIGSPETIVVSMLDANTDGLWYFPGWGALDVVIDDVGFGRPALQEKASRYLTGISLERIEELDGNVLITGYRLDAGQSVAQITTWLDSGGGLWRKLPGGIAGQHFWYDRNLWNGRSFASLEASLSGLLLLTAGKGGEP